MKLYHSKLILEIWNLRQFSFNKISKFIINSNIMEIMKNSGYSLLGKYFYQNYFIMQN